MKKSLIMCFYAPLRGVALAALLGLSGLPVWGQILPQARMVPGGVAVLDLGAGLSRPQASFNGKPVLVLGDAQGWTAVVGIALAAQPGPASLQVTRTDAATSQLGFVIAPTQYAEQRLTVAPSKVDLSKTDLARYEKERSHLGVVAATMSEALPPTLRLIQPTPGPRSSSFGLRRVFNKQARSPHSGMDIAAPTGTAVVSPAAGRVIDVGDYFFNGKTVWVDHGSGFISMVCHLSATTVALGDWLETGQKLGEVGATGRATGPHLHWSVALNQAWVDPALFMAAVP